VACGLRSVLFRGFKALKQLVKLYYKLQQYAKMMESYRTLLSYAESSTVTKNASEKKINSLLDFMAGASDSEVGVGEATRPGAGRRCPWLTVLWRVTKAAVGQRRG
jgi:hypothetical protein